MHEVHRPDLVNIGSGAQGLGPLAHQAFARLDAQVQFQFAIDSVDCFLVPACSASNIAGIAAPVELVTKQPAFDHLSAKF